MIKRLYSPDSKRALNIIWNAAGDYDFDPCFMAYYSTGRPDFYFDMVIGLVKKWTDMDKILAFFDSFSYAREYAEFDDLIWLGLESYVYEKELPERPIMESLRKEHAEEFFAEQQRLSRQQMESMSMLTYTQQQARWAFVTGRRLPMMSKKEKGMHEALMLSGEMDTDELIAALKDFLSTYRGFTFNEAEYRKKHKPGIIRKLWGTHKKGQFKKDDRLVVRTGTGTEDLSNAVHLNQETGFAADKNAGLDWAYIMGCFGPSIYPDSELREIESILCRGSDRNVHLWFTKSRPSLEAASNDMAENAASAITSPDSFKYTETTDALSQDSSGIIDQKILMEIRFAKTGNNDSPDALAKGSSSKINQKLLKEIRLVKQEAAEQRQKNIAYYQANSLQIRENIKQLSSGLEVLISTFLKHLPEKAVSGKLVPSKAYRLPVFNDTMIFVKDGEEAENDLRVDILLDASKSRMNAQELISAEAFIISESMMKAGIQVQVLSFRSLRSYTVLEELKAFDERSSYGVFDYFSAGWNRDALAFKAAGHLIDEDIHKNGRQRHILLVLTDASPNDSAPLAPMEGGHKSRNYEGLPPVEDARLAVNALRERGIATAAVFHGSSIHLENLYQIYGKEYVRIRSLAQLAMGLISLLQMVLMEMDCGD